MDLKYKSRLGSSSSSDSMFFISVGRTESSTVATTLWCVQKRISETVQHWTSDNIGSVLSPYDVNLMKTVKLWKKEGIILLLLCITVLLDTTNTISRDRLRLGGCSVFAIVGDLPGPQPR
jgi:hypothetical protein